MKRIIAAVLLCFMLTVLCITGKKEVNKNCREVINELKTCEEIFEKGEKNAANNAEKINKKWQSRQKSLALFVNHGLLDTAADEISALPHHAKHENIADFYVCSAKIKRTLSQIIKEESIALESFY